MPADALDELLARMPEIAASVNLFSSESIQIEVLRTLLASLANDPQLGDAQPSKSQATPSPQELSSSNKDGKAESTKKNGPKVKSSFSMDKNLDFVNGATQSFGDFCEQKRPTSMKEKCLVSVYWLTRLAKNPSPATVDQVYTCFKQAGWPVPNDLLNTLQQTGSAGWLDTKKRDDLKVVVQGENYLELKMPVELKASGK
jgi:hypothetical protein